MLPLLSAVVFLPSLLLPSSSLYERFLGLVSVASLGATAYAMRAFGVALPARSLKGKMPVPDASARRWLLPVNTACCGFLCLVYALIDPESLRNTSPELYLVPAGGIPAFILENLLIHLSHARHYPGYSENHDQRRSVSSRGPALRVQRPLTVENAPIDQCR